jgi:hypothetical protein
LTFSSKRFLLTKKGVWDKVDVFIRNYFYDFVLHILFPRNGSIKKGTLVFFIFWPGYFFYFILRSIQPKLRVFCQKSALFVSLFAVRPTHRMVVNIKRFSELKICLGISLRLARKSKTF